MKTKFILFLFAIAVVLSCNRCKEECDDATNPECPNYVAPVDPCAGHSEVRAEFVMEEKVQASGPGAPIYRLTEGVACTIDDFNPVSRPLRLTASQDYENYKWIIGSDTIYNQSYEFYFPGSYIGQTIPITLIVEDTIDSLCFPIDNGKDTLTKYITISSFQGNPIFGEYKIAWDIAPQDSFIVKISTPEIIDNIVYLKNFTQIESIDSCGMDIFGYGYKYVHLTTQLGPCQIIRGEFWINQDNSFEAQYQFDPDESNGIHMADLVAYHAKGRRLN
jgi:hypothetical protein